MPKLGVCEVAQRVVYTQIDFLQANVSQLESQAISLWADVVVMNPPFGTRRKGADVEFLRAAFQVKQCRKVLFTCCAQEALCNHRLSEQLPNIPCQCLCNAFVTDIWKPNMGMDA